MAFTQTEVREMMAKIDQMRQVDSDDIDAVFSANMTTAQTWWDTIKPSSPTTRAEALTVFQFIDSEHKTQKTNFENETNPVQKDIFHFRVLFLVQKKEQANEKFKERKRNG